MIGNLELEEKQEDSERSTPTVHVNLDSNVDSGQSRSHLHEDIDYKKVNDVLSRNSYSNFKTIKKTKVRKYIASSVEQAILALTLLMNF